MKKLLLTFIVGLFCISAFAQQSQVIPLSAGENQLRMRGVNPESFNAKLSYKELSFENSSYPEGDFSVLELEDAVKPNNIGQASLPVISKMIEIPYGAEISIVINSYDEEVINLSDYGIDRIAPTQPSYQKNTPEDEMYFVIDEDYYSTDEYETTPLVVGEIHGVMRGFRVGRIEIRPYHYNPVENTIIFYNNLDFSVHFVGADIATTEEMKNRYYTNEFEALYSSAINYIAPATKDAFFDTSNPIKYVLIANTFFQSTLQPFVEWKTRQGYNVIEYYVSSGTSNTSIQAYLEGLYNSASASDPAPLYALIIGDHSGNYSIPAFDTPMSGKNHVTDVYFGEFTGDYMPEMYIGRISCNTTTELQNALDKILPYEQYTMPSTTHLNNAVLIAGVDPTWGPKAGDGAIWYFAEHYINAAHGFDNVYAYYQDHPSGPYFAGDSDNSSTDSNIIANIGDGIGFANYTAHCMDYGWADPSVTNDDIASFNNLNEYPFMIGNCCLSYQFNVSDAFGENLLQTANVGAVGYIGTSNNSLWDEDFWWGIGLTSMSISTANVGNYDPSNSDDGVYDALMHENGQGFSEWYTSASQMIYSGNAAVQASSSGNKQYYWEIYHCSGDPSLIPYMSEPDALSLSFTNPFQGATTLVVTTEPYTYVGLSKNNELIDAKWSGAGTTVTLTSATPFNGETYCVVGTKQDRAPYINESIVPIAPNPPVAAFSGTPTTILEGESVTFTDASDYAASWSWTFGDGGTSTEQNPVYTYITAGTYTVALTVTNGLGNDTETKVDYITVNVNTNPPTAEFIADATSVDVGATVNFTDLSTDLPTGWSWSFEGGTPTSSTDQNPSVVYNTPGVFEVTLTASNTYGSDDEIKSDYITVMAPDVLMSDGTTTACAGLFKDSGGDAAYSNNEDMTHTLYPGTVGAFAQLTFTELDIENNGTSSCYDEISIYDGEGTTNLIGTYCGTDHTAIGTGGVVTSTDPTGALTIVFTSDYSETRSGWSAEISCYSPSTPPTAGFTSDVTSSCTGLVQFTDASTLAESWLWNFGDGTTSSDQNPLHTYTADGTYTVSLYVENAYGNDTYEVNDMITVAMLSAPTTVGDEACGAATLTLNAAGNGVLAWYDAAIGGTEVTTGTSYTNTFSSTATYYVQSGITPEYFSGGSSDIDVNGGNHTSNAYYLIFNANEDFRLVSVQVNSSTAGDRVVELRNSSDVILESQTVSLTTGINTIVLNFDIPVGNDYQLRCGTATPNLWRNNNATNWPYEIGDVASITGTNAGDENYYYYYYNWEIMTGDECVSPRTPVVATINDVPVVDLGDDITQCEGDALLDAGSGMSSYTWNGSAGSQTYTATTNGTYTVEVENAAGCTATDDILVTFETMPTVDAPADVTECETYTLPALSDGEYFATTGGVTPIAEGSAITATQTIYVYASNGTCEAENSFTVTIDDIPTVDAPADVTECESYILPALTNGDYYANTGGVSPIAEGTAITLDQTIYVYASNGTCEAENSFTVTIDDMPTVDAPADVTACETYTLPALTNGAYFASTGGVTPIAEGTAITSTQTIYVYASNGTCEAENSFTVTIDDMPTVDAPANVEACDSYSLPALSNGAYFASSGGVTPIAEGTAITTDQTVYVYASNGTCEAENSFDITIFDGFTAIATSIDESGVGTNDGSVTVVMTGGAAPFGGEWNNGAATNSAGSSMILSPLNGGYYEVTVTDDNGCTATAGATVNTAGAAPVANFSADNTDGCDNLIVTFTDLSNNTPSSWSWTFGDGNTSSDQNPVHTYASAGTYTVSLTATNGNGSDDVIMTDYITVGETPSLIMSMTQETVAGNDGTATVAITGGTTPYTILWSNTDDTETISGLVADNYCVTVTEDNGCTVSDCIDVTQEVVSNEPVADFEADVTESCGTLTVNFTDLSTNTPTSYVWNFGDGSATSSETNPSHTYSAAGVYTVTLYVENADGNDNMTMIDYISVYELPVVTVDVTNASGASVADGAATANITGGTAPYEISWSTSESGTSISDLLPGNYSVIVQDDNSCVATTPFVIDWDTFAEINETVYSIYPNPAYDLVYVQFDDQICETIEIYDMLGQVVNVVNPTEDKLSVDVSDMKTGIYFVKVIFADKEFTHKLVIK